MSDVQGGHAISDAPVLVCNQNGSSPYLLVCEHASNHIPEVFGGLGLGAEARGTHIAWDLGAAAVARRLSRILDAPLVEAGLSRLLIDCNRPLEAPDLIPEISETTLIPGNHGLSAAERMARIERIHRSFHGRLHEVIAQRAAGGLLAWIVSIHSFTPVYRGVRRPWPVGIIHGEDQRLARPLIAALARDERLHVGVNQPYSTADRVYYTLERHAHPRHAPGVMIEIRNDEIAELETQIAWGERLAEILKSIEPSLKENAPLKPRA